MFLLKLGAESISNIKEGDLDLVAAYFSLSLVSIYVLSSFFIQGEHFSDTRIQLNVAGFSIVRENRFVHAQTEYFTSSVLLAICSQQILETSDKKASWLKFLIFRVFIIL